MWILKPQAVELESCYLGGGGAHLSNSATCLASLLQAANRTLLL